MVILHNSIPPKNQFSKLYTLTYKDQIFEWHNLEEEGFNSRNQGPINRIRQQVEFYFFIKKNIFLINIGLKTK